MKQYDLKSLSNILINGGVGIFPTDTVYGIGCNAFDDLAIKKLFDYKKRDLSKPINVLISNKKMLDKLVNNISDIEQKLMDSFWPGALTIVFKKNPNVSDLLTAGLDSIGVRMPNNQICLELIDNVGLPLATSSANISNDPPIAYINENLIKNFNNKVDFILDFGKIDTILPSTIVRVDDDKINILREGPISLNDILEVIK